MASNCDEPALLVTGNPISRLSADHFSIIVEFLEDHDIRSARLAGRELHFFLSPYLFRSINFYPSQEGLDTLEMISQNDAFSRNVRVLRFDTSLFLSRWHASDDWDIQRIQIRAARDMISGSPTRQGHDHLDYPKPQVLQKYDKSVAEQSSINADLEMHLDRILNAFPGISTVTFTNTSIKYSTRFKDLLQKDHFHSRMWVRSYQFFGLINTISKARCKITKIDIEGHWRLGKFVDNRGFGDDSRTPGSIKHAFPDYEHARCWKKQNPTIDSFTFDLTPERLSTIQYIFSNLTYLTLSITTVIPLEERNMAPQSVPKSYWSDLPEVLKALSNIIQLSVDLNVRRRVHQQLEWTYYHDDIAELFNDSNLALPHLSSLSLTHFRSCGPSLLSLLERHSNVKNLTLSHVIEIKNPDIWVDPYRIGRPVGLKWVELIETMRALRLQRLNLCGLEGFGCDFRGFGYDFNIAGSENTNLLLARVHDYILHGYGDNPLGPNRDANDDWDAELW